MNILDYLDYQTLLLTADKVHLKIEVTPRLYQPFGVLHGGINGLLIETACSLGAMQNVLPGEVAVGLDLQVSHLKAVTTGSLEIIATPDKIGKTLQVWQASIYQGTTKTAVGRCSLLNTKIKETGKNS